jgi:hypothetical protein
VRRKKRGVGGYEKLGLFTSGVAPELSNTRAEQCYGIKYPISYDLNKKLCPTFRVLRIVQ